MLVDVKPAVVTARPGVPVHLAVTVTNDGTLISEHRVQVLGVDPAWVSLDRPDLKLFPDASGTVLVTVTFPTGIPAGTRRVDVEVVELTPPRERVVVPVDLKVPADLRLGLRVDPVSATGGRQSVVAVIGENRGNAPIDLELTGLDDEGVVDFAFDPPDPVLGPGEQLIVKARLRAPRPLFGSPKIRPYQVQAGPASAPTVAQGAWVQRPRFSRGSLTLMGLLATATVFAVVVAVALSQVVSTSNTNSNLALQAAAAQASDTAGGGRAQIGGTVTSVVTGAAVQDVTVVLYAASATSSPVVSTTTDQAGGYLFQGLPAGGYKLHFT